MTEIVHHHIPYNEIHGVDEVVLMEKVLHFKNIAPYVQSAPTKDCNIQMQTGCFLKSNLSATQLFGMCKV